MPTYTVHAPPGDKARDAQRFVFVRDGFHFWAFLITPLWLIAKRMWLVLLFYVLLSLGFAIAFVLAGTPGGYRYGIEFVLALLVGLESGTLQRWSYRKWTTLGVVVGRNEEEAERRFFTEWTGRVPAVSPGASPSTAAPPRRSTPDVIGSFPQPGVRP